MKYFTRLKNYKDANFTTDQKEDMHYWLKYNKGVTDSEQVNAPSANAKYNCYAYTVGRDDFWINDPITLILYDFIWMQDEYGSAECTVAGYNYDPDDYVIVGHLSKYDYGETKPVTGKWGAYGIYQTAESKARAAYGSDSHYYKAR